MYSYEDRLRAVRLYIKLGKRIAATIRQLGYPTKNALKSWHREYEQRLDLPTGYVWLPKYSQAQKERTVEQVDRKELGARSDDLHGRRSNGLTSY